MLTMTKKLVCSVGKLFAFMLQLQLVASQLPSDQVSAMTRIYDIIQNNTAYSSSFVWNDVLKTSNPCSWNGVLCTSDNSSITQISFTSFSISTSELLPVLCNIPTLESLDVSNNQLSSIPESFFTICGEKINGLKLLNFSVNKLVGSLSSFNNGFPMLEILDFSHNLLSGEIGMQLDGLDSLKILNISKNNFMGSIPSNLGKVLNFLEELLLSANSFTGEIPLEITKYSNLRVIDLSYNELSGFIPKELGEMKKLETLVLSVNNLTGSIPPSLSNITTLKRFAAPQNKLIGSIPPRITSYLTTLDLSYNRLQGIIPLDLLSGAKLKSLDLSFNQLEGPIPAINSTKLLRLRLSSNSLNGTISSASLTSLVELMYLELDGNLFSGEIPLELGMCKNLASLNLANNQLKGTLPRVFSNLTNLEFLSLELNSFVGEIPPEISQLKRLWELNMNQNALSGSISWVSNLSSLRKLQLGGNQFTGIIPGMPAMLQIALNLSYNLFSGHIPDSLGILEKLEVLDLSNNRLSGKVPTILLGLQSLTYLLLSNNELSGLLPLYPDYVVVDISGNNNLIDPRDVHSKNPPRPQRKTKAIDTGLVIAVASGFPVGLLISMIAIFISKRYKRIQGNLSTPNSIHSPNVDFKKGMEAVANPSNITLKARFSTFYKAFMPSGTTYLVKKVNHSHNIFRLPQHKELLEDLELLGSLSNSNVMIPIAYVLTVRRAYLFYGCVGGTLYDTLHHRMGNKLDWPTRYTIAVGVAQGLAFLHECSSGPIILLDLCSRSILLKSPDEPLISDIELSKLIYPSKRRGTSMLSFVGTDGYVPPEYACTNRATAAGNVYSFGVVLLELLSGKPAVSGGTELARSVLSISDQPSRWDQILDSSVSETSVGVRKQMLSVVEVALACISISPQVRPNTITVLQMLLSRRLCN